MKDMREKAMKIRIKELLKHKNSDNLHLFSMTEGHETGATHTAETLYRFISDSTPRKYLLHVLYIQIDNCPRESKNLYRSAYIKSLVSLDGFQYI